MAALTASQARELATRALAAIAPEANLTAVGDDEGLREALDLDSMDFMNFVIALAEGSGRNIPEADTPKLRTMRGLVDYLAR